MKTITLTVEDDVYEQAVQAAAQRRKSLGDLFRELVVALRGSNRSPVEGSLSALQSAWNLADSKPLREGSAGPLNRDDLYERGVS
jgi:hypothetical protein